MRERLHAIANAEDRQPRVKDVLLDIGSVRLIDGARPAGQDEALRMKGHDRVSRRIPRVQLAIDMRLAYSSCDQLGILRAKIEDSDRISHQFFSDQFSAMGITAIAAKLYQA